MLPMAEMVSPQSPPRKISNEDSSIHYSDDLQKSEHYSYYPAAASIDEASTAWHFPWAPPPMLPNDDDRVMELESYGILDTPNEHVFDVLVSMATKALRCPIGGVSLIDKHRQWCKASIGLAQTVIPRNVAFCAHTIASTKPLVVLDTSLDKRFYQNPLVTGPANIQFYAGAPIVNGNGTVLGTVFVYGHRPQTSCDTQVLKKLARMAMNHLDDRKQSMQRARPARSRSQAQPRTTSVPRPTTSGHHPAMMMDRSPADEYDARREAMRLLDILDTPPEVIFDRVCSLATQLLHCSVAGVSLIDDDKQWFKAHVGNVDLGHVATFCAHTIAARKTTVVVDTLEDTRFRKNPLVRSGSRIRFFAAVPIYTPDEHVIGTVFVMDTAPRTHATVDVNSLQRLARVAMLHLAPRVQYKIMPVLDYSSFVDEHAQVYSTDRDAMTGKAKGANGFEKLRLKFLSTVFKRQPSNQNGHMY
ncbi:hypothetical protein SDRG_11079 [Saprolegnia diclina VS20]|uniref:GAF domain-containing protein n=1 Tax=Saprolegnia diclina (strain VS20) TaxID=1156394 RepID=T0Q909_SAPDV|nr:hypothetical protein SDRG_11079 [Saprolegnia diclina VS20]EQC31151.1 hypothetical protein SDRG_11079 [Saprolegnia diclina VS20]|eukprot:XP_008615324.1 hypothetical protein SDRG_11079 [Saprolegnia diclina VS20]